MRKVPKLFSPFSLRSVTIKNRIAVSPMAMYMAKEGIPDAFHLVHYGKFAMGGAGVVFVEETAISREARITNGCLGLWNDQQQHAFSHLAQTIHELGAQTCIQISHCGRKGSAQRAWEGNSFLNEANIAAGDEAWIPKAASADAFAEGWTTPEAMTRQDMDDVITGFVQASSRAYDAGFSMIELHMAHGYLLQGFLSPLANKRSDNYGGNLTNRMRFPLEVTEAVRSALPDNVPLLARISATDWIEGGWDMEDSLALVEALKNRGVDLIDCSSGGNMVAGATNANITRGPGYQVPFSERIRQETGIKTQAVGLIRTAKQAEEILQKNQADLVAIGRQMLVNPFWAHHAAEYFGVTNDFDDWPQPYGWWLSKWAKGLNGLGEKVLPHE